MLPVLCTHVDSTSVALNMQFGSKSGLQRSAMMNSSWRDIEVCAFDGRPLVQCDAALPVLRHRSTGMYCIPTTIHEDFEPQFEDLEFNKLVQEDRVTPIAAPRPAMKGGLVAYATEDLLRTVAVRPGY